LQVEAAKRIPQGLNRLPQNSIGAAILKGQDFSRADKTNQIKVGFSR
jgi:hypothetical protein